jgi:hypothetical protein
LRNQRYYDKTNARFSQQNSPVDCFIDPITRNLNETIKEISMKLTQLSAEIRPVTLIAPLFILTLLPGCASLYTDKPAQPIAALQAIEIPLTHDAVQPVSRIRPGQPGGSWEARHDLLNQRAAKAITTSYSSATPLPTVGKTAENPSGTNSTLTGNP